MEKIKARCYLCEKTFELDDLIGDVQCPYCKQTIEKEKAYKYCKKIEEVVSEDKRVAHGENYRKVDLILDKVDYFIEHGDYENAKTELNNALEITNSDYRVWFDFVRVETANFTDYRSTTYKDYLEKANDCADDDAKAEIKRRFSDYYAKTQMTDEQLSEYKNEENQEVKDMMEKGLKKLFPEFASKEKGLKKYFLFAMICLGLLIATIIVGFATNVELFFIVATVFAVGMYVFLRIWYNGKQTVGIFNDLIDVYDEYAKFDLNADAESKLLDIMSDLLGSIYDGETINVINIGYGKLCVYLAELELDCVNEFITSHKRIYNNI